MSLMNSSILATAMARPTSTWARSRSLAEQEFGSRETTSSRKAMKAESKSFSVITNGRPPSSATMFALNEDYSGAEAIELVEHDVRHRLALELDHHVITMAVALVSQW